MVGVVSGVNSEAYKKACEDFEMNQSYLKLREESDRARKKREEKIEKINRRIVRICANDRATSSDLAEDARMLALKSDNICRCPVCGMTYNERIEPINHRHRHYHNLVMRSVQEYDIFYTVEAAIAYRDEAERDMYNGVTLDQRVEASRRMLKAIYSIHVLRCIECDVGPGLTESNYSKEWVSVNPGNFPSDVYEELKVVYKLDGVNLFKAIDYVDELDEEPCEEVDFDDVEVDNIIGSLSS